jgi:hypothetical protein
MRYLLCLLLGTIFLNTEAAEFTVFPQDVRGETDTIAPKVFIIGEYERQYEELMGEHSTLLLTACKDDMNVAFEKWQEMLIGMEEQAEMIGYDLKGIKLWLNIFWEGDGNIKHIAYHLKPNSRNVDTDKLSMFFINFINNYQFPLAVGKKFSHYGMASFPTFLKKPVPKSNSNASTPLGKDSMNAVENNKR